MSDRRPARLSRRGFLAGSGALGLGAALSAGPLAKLGRAAAEDGESVGTAGRLPVRTGLADLAGLAAEVGAGEPVCFVDLAAVDANLAHLVGFADEQGWSVRPSLKSFRSAELAAYVLGRLREPRGMVFHLRHVDPIVEVGREGIDLLTGYVPTIGELEAYMARTGPSRPHRVRITVDSLPLLDRVIDLARDGERELPIEVCLELDSGSGRGGFHDVDQVVAATRRVAAAQDAVRLTALLCYDGHATLTPVDAVRSTVATDARRRLAHLHDAIRQAGGGAVGSLEVNGPGSSNYRHWAGDPLLTEMSPGSAILYARYLAAGFDDEDLSIGCVLSAPVLRVVGPFPRVPLTAIALPWASREQLMLKGGGWPSASGRQPTMIWPGGLEDNELYGGRGTNTGTITAPAGALDLGDHVLMWPHQVGDAIDHFGVVTAVRDSEVEARWPTFTRWGA